MNKRHFLGTAALAGLWPAVDALAADPERKGPGLLTVSGAIGKSNRGAVDPALDQLLVKHGVKFDKAFVFDSDALRRLPVTRIKATLEYDAKMHALAGPLLTSVLEAAGVPTTSEVTIALRAVDGYVVPLSMANARAYRMIVATEIDGTPLALGGLGPQWAIYEADTLAAFKDKPLKERFALCPWGLYSIEVTRG
ncbi:molybdopterin-dependent oxidoreductase [Variovorax sp. J2P1-59]|uniref:molybdopterin-dependent oxidoreductase n=1 Tax=Variovorax flavidus TaxID=3053501 RepID=UPI0025769601|nr:molybdopterin-dependent oxidoreductase [Variovorax sp. J2P1-59]MDM0077952.1 molybdopterin-dependent oxidoreductase [Variovorax sp. J2P1-59]